MKSTTQRAVSAEDAEFDHRDMLRDAFRRRSQQRAWMWGSFAGVALAAFALGLAGYGQVYEQAGDKASVSGLRGGIDRIYYTLQLFTLESNLGTDVRTPPLLVVARVLATLCFGFAMLKAAAILLGDQFRNLMLWRTRGHTVICGLGAKGFAVARAELAAKKRVVVIERDKGNEDLALCRELGALIVLGDANDPEILARAHVEHAARLVVVTGDDGVNAAIATSVAHEQAAWRENKQIDCCAHIYDSNFYSDILNQRIQESSRGGRMRFLNAFDSEARRVLADHGLERDLVGANDPRSVHLVIVGFGWLGRSLAAEAARMGHYANGRQLQITIVDPELDGIRPAFERRYPEFASICAVDWQAGRIEERETLAAIARALAPEDDLPPPIATILFCRDGDVANLAAAMTVHGSLLARANAADAGRPIGDVHLGVRIEGPSHSSPLLQSWTAKVSPHRHIFWFGGLVPSFVAEVRDGSDGRRLHEIYMRHQGGGGNVVDWDDLPPTLKASNDHHRRHLPVKLRAAGCELLVLESGSPAPGFAFDLPGEIDLLAEMEHRRWNAERWMDGWRWGPAKDVSRKISHCLVPWEQLPDSEREKDRAFIRSIPELLAQEGLGVRRVTKRSHLNP